MPTATTHGEQLAIRLAFAARREPSQTMIEACSLIERHAHTLHSLHEQLCNGYTDYRGQWDERATEKAEQRVEQLEQRITKIVHDLPSPTGHYTATFQGDPRGAPVRIGHTHKTIRERLIANDWGRRGWPAGLR